MQSRTFPSELSLPSTINKGSIPDYLCVSNYLDKGVYAALICWQTRTVKHLYVEHLKNSEAKHCSHGKVLAVLRPPIF